jgi:hypothetical protein
MVCCRFTEFWDGLGTLRDEESGVETPQPLLLNGRPVQLNTLYRALAFGNTIVTVVWRPIFTITGSKGLCPRAEVVHLVVYPGTGNQRPVPTVDSVMGTQIKCDMAQLEALRKSAGTRGITDAPANGGFDGDNGDDGDDGDDGGDGDAGGNDGDDGDDADDPPVAESQAAAVRNILGNSRRQPKGRQ